MDTQTDTEFTISDKVLRKPPTEARAALIRAIRHALATKVWPDEARARWMDGTAEVVTDSVLAAMPDWVLMPRVATADWTGSTKRAVPDAEVARLRAALDQSSFVADRMLATAKGDPLRLVKVSEETFRDLMTDPLRAALAGGDGR